MNESTLTQLKVIVERAVRPVRAGVVRKRKMREELLAHVSAVFAQERARLGDDAAALARAAERFGDPGELTRDLQESVPWIDWIASFVTPPLCLLRPGESRWRFAVRQCLELSFFLSWTATAGAVLLFGVASLVTLDSGRPVVPAREMPLLLAGAGIGLLVSIAVASAVIFLLHGMIHALYERGRSWPLILLLGGAASLLGVSFPLVLSGLGQAGTQAKGPGLLAALPCAAVIGPVLLICLASACRRMTDGPVSRPWRSTARSYAGWSLVVAGVTFEAAVGLSGDAGLSLKNTLQMMLAIASWVIPLELALCSPTAVARFRSDQEWAMLPIGASPY